MNITFDTLESVSFAYSSALRNGLPVTEYDAWGIEYRRVPATEVRAEAERKAKAQKAVAKKCYAAMRPSTRRATWTTVPRSCAAPATRKRSACSCSWRPSATCADVSTRCSMDSTST